MNDGTITLTGDNFLSYQAGVHFGSATALSDSAAHVRKLEKRLRELNGLAMTTPLLVATAELPVLLEVVTSAKDQLVARADAHSRDGAKLVVRMKHLHAVQESWLFRQVAVGPILVVGMVIGALLYALTIGR